MPELYTVVVDTIELTQSKRHAGLLLLKYEEVEGEQWPALKLWGTRDKLTRFLTLHCGGGREGAQYFRENAKLEKSYLNPKE